MSDTIKTGEPLSDSELVKLWAEGGKSAEEAFDMLTKRYIGLVLSITMKYRVSGHEPQDLTQEGLLGLLSAVQTYKEDRGASFKTYASACINHRIAELLRKSGTNARRAMTDYISIYEEGVTEVPGGVEPEQLVLSQEGLEALRKAILEILSDREQKVLKLYLGGSSYSQIAEKLNITDKSVDNAIQRIRKKLRDNNSGISY
ncbi:MAG: sigma-70 family RNA polymerase sigma factor [Clostridia bacterium]|nr:sigma-70 family RNA polymerase sigma factor [Clostridia bacterium]